MRKLRWMFLTLFLSLLVSPFPAAATTEIEPPGPGSALVTDRVSLDTVDPGGVSPAWWSRVQEGIQQSEYEISWQEPTGLPDLPGAYQAPNRAQGFRTYFTPAGIRLVPRAGEQVWDEMLGASGGRALSEPAELFLGANRIEYRWPARVERYTNTPEGLQHTIILAEAAAGGTQSLELAFSGDLGVRLGEREQVVELFSATGEAILHYGRPAAVDAQGRSLPLHLVLSSGDFMVQLDASDVQFPITVTAMLSENPSSPDGLSPTPDWMAEGNQAGSDFGSVATAGDVNGDGYSDVLVGADEYDNGQTGEGRVYLYLGSADGLELTPAWMAEGNQAGAVFGSIVGTAGDVNGDGYADIFISAFWYDNGQEDEGRAYVYYGSAGGLGANPNWVAESNQAYAYLGQSVAAAGDVNGDGYSDLLVGARRYDNGQSDEGGVWLYYGSASGLSTNPSWHVESNQADAYMGLGLDTAGDVNGDGYDDVVVGTHMYDNGQADEGRADVYYGSASGLHMAPDWTVEGNQVAAGLGMSVGTAGDVNGDGYADVIVGAWQYDNGQADEGRAYLYYGSALGLHPAPDWIAESNQAGAKFGRPLGTAGDVNGDGYADVIVGAQLYDNGQTDEGGAFVYCGSSTGLGATPCWQGEGNQDGAYYDMVYTAGDINGDGYSDVIVGAWQYSNDQVHEGRAFVYHGSPTGLGSTPAWTSEGDQAGAGWGGQLHTAGDVNGDGYADVLVAALFYDNGQTDEGLVSLYLGSADGLESTPAWTVESDQANSDFGTVVGTAGDLNGDGYDDVVIGARYYDNGETDEGRVYVYYGSAQGLSPSPDWTAEGNQAGASFGRGASTAGDVNGDGYADLLIGAPYYDNGQTDEGRIYLYLGSASGLGSTPDWTAEVDVADSYLGWWVNPAGDVNGDGYSDVIAGAPHYENGQWREGAVFAYYGSPSGFGANPDWQVESNVSEAQLGYAVDTAGDVNGDGYSDVIVGAYMYTNGQSYEGAVFSYNGSATGLQSTPSWQVEGNQANAQLGVGLGGGGDVNGDGYADVVVGAYLYDNGQTDEGRAWGYYGSPVGLNPSPNWVEEGDQIGAGFGDKVEFAGDVNGDGYADVLVGSYLYDNDQADEGRAFLYYGNAGDGLDLAPEQMRTDGSVPIARLGMSDLGDAVQLRLTGRMPLGREDVKLQWQVAPLGTPLTGTAVISGTSAGWTDVLTTGVVIAQNVTGLTPDTPYHWRVRLLYEPGNRLGQVAGRWVQIPWHSWTEEDFRTWACEPVQDVSFSWAPITPTVGEVMTLTGQATGTPPLDYSWDLGDGTAAGGEVANHVYTAPGAYTVTLTVTNGCGQDWITHTMTVLPVCEPVQDVSFGWTPVTPTVGQEVTLTGQATGTAPLDYRWELGDGTTAGGAVVTHVYGLPGVYTAILTVTNSCGREVTTATVRVEGVCEPIFGAGFTWAPVTPTLGEVVTLTGTASGTLPLSFAWDLGDGTAASGAVIHHAYSAPGPYAVILTVTNACGQEVVTHTLRVTCDPVHDASFDWMPPSPLIGDPVTLNGNAAGSPVIDYAWDLGDGTLGSGATVVHSYTAAGDYTVVMTATNGCGRMAVDQVVTVYDECQAPGGASFTWTPLMPAPGQAVDFTADLITGTAPLTYTWDWGDSGTATGATATHTFATAGSYTVALTVKNACGEVETETVLVVAECAPVEDVTLSWEPVTPTVGENVILTGHAAGTAPLAFSWAFGDGAGAEGSVVSHSYAAAGTYVVMLMVTNGCGGKVATDTITVMPHQWRIYLPCVLKQSS